MHEVEEVTSTKKKNFSRGRIFTVAGILVLVLCLSCAGYYYSHRYVAGKITFQEYAPDYLPQDTHIKEKSIDATYVPSGRPTRYTSLNISLNNGFIYEEDKDTHNFNHNCPRNDAENETCVIRTTPKGQQYILNTLTSPKDVPRPLTTQTIDWLKGETAVRMNFDSQPAKEYSQVELEKVIDSFKPVHFDGLPFNYYDRSKI